MIFFGKNIFRVNSQDKNDNCLRNKMSILIFLKKVANAPQKNLIHTKQPENSHKLTKIHPSIDIFFNCNVFSTGTVM